MYCALCAEKISLKKWAAGLPQPVRKVKLSVASEEEVEGEEENAAQSISTSAYCKSGGVYNCQIFNQNIKNATISVR